MTRKRLIVMRHGKSAWNTDTSDHDRPLNKRGRKDASMMAGELVRMGWLPDNVISSDSQRTRETWENMASMFGHRISVSFYRQLYLAGLDAFQTHVEGESDEVETLLVLGHNPGWEDVVESLTGQPIQMTTANAVLMHKFSADWTSAVHSPEMWQVEAILRPREPRTTAR